jgi:hypothetical protein
MELYIKLDQQLIYFVKFIFSFSFYFLFSSHLDESAGGSDDWAKGVGQIKYVYTVELRPSDDLNDAHAHFAFMLPTTFIELVGRETYVGVKEFLRSIITSRRQKPLSKNKYQI